MGMLLDQGRETLGTTLLDAEPDVILLMPGDSYLPFLLSVSVTAIFVSLLLHSGWALGVTTFGTFVASVWWLWPQKALGQIQAQHD
jgi:cytochrome c oxidase subunit 1/cytochrome c oxidase subunit I+III